MMTAIRSDLFARLAAIVGDERVVRDYALGPMTTYRVGGAADLFIDVADADELGAIASIERDGLPVVVIGRGSNLLVSDQGFRGLALRLGAGFDRTDIAPDGIVFAGAARSLPLVARETVRAGLTGFEWAVGVPGSIGGAIRMNAGGHGSSMAESVVDASIVDLNDGTSQTLTLDELGFGYRTSIIAPHHCVVSTTLQLAPGDVLQGSDELSEIVRWRRAHQPGGQNAGSVFTNPPNDSAGRLIDTAGCKGLRVGTAEVSTKHANFIQADVGGSADDIRSLMGLVRERVLASHGVELEAETRLVGFDDDQPAAEPAAPTSPSAPLGGTP